MCSSRWPLVVAGITPDTGWRACCALKSNHLLSCIGTHRQMFMCLHGPDQLDQLAQALASRGSVPDACLPNSQCASPCFTPLFNLPHRHYSSALDDNEVNSLTSGFELLSTAHATESTQSSDVESHSLRITLPGKVSGHEHVGRCGASHQLATDTCNGGFVQALVLPAVW